MSTFTQFNGPQGSYGPSAKDMAELIAAYNQLSTQLNSHIQKTVAFSEETGVTESGFVHGVKTALDQFYVKLTGKADKTAFNELQRLVEETSNVANANKTKLTNTEAQVSINTSEVATLKTNTSELTRKVGVHGTDISALKALTTELEQSVSVLMEVHELLNVLSFADNGATVAQFEPIISSAKYILGKIHALKIIDFTQFAEVNAQFAGTGAMNDTVTNGLYVLGKLSSDWTNQGNAPTTNIFKAARAYIKYENTKPFDAIVDMCCSTNGTDFNGAITAQVSKGANEWTGLQFHLVSATDNKGEKAIYLCISADGLAKDAYNSSALNFLVAGVNFIPLDEDTAKRVQTVHLCASTVDISTDNSATTALTSLTADSAKVKKIITDYIVDTKDNSIMRVVHDVENTLYIDTENVVFAGVPSVSIENELVKLVTEKKLVEELEKYATLEALQAEATLREEADNAILDKFVDYPTKEEVAQLIDQEIIDDSVQVGETMFWAHSDLERRTVVSDKPFVFTFKGKEYTIDVEDAVVDLIVATDVPSKWHALDGSAELDASEYPELAAFFGDSNITSDGKIWLPYVQQKIIKIKY